MVADCQSSSGVICTALEMTFRLLGHSGYVFSLALTRGIQSMSKFQTLNEFAVSTGRYFWYLPNQRTLDPGGAQ